MSNMSGIFAFHDQNHIRKTIFSAIRLKSIAAVHSMLRTGRSRDSPNDDYGGTPLVLN